MLIHIKTTPPLAGSNVWVRCFDVDDTTDDTFDNAGVIDPNGRAGNDNFADYLLTPQAGLFVANGQASYQTTLNASGEATVEFRVGMQPGNNYRIAATVFPTNNLNTLQITNEATSGFVSAYTDEVTGGFNGVLSPLLTVWRKLHLEIDSMTAVPTSGPEANFVTDKIWVIKPNQPNAGQTEVYFSYNNRSWQNNQFENGTLTIPAAGVSYPVLGNNFITHYIAYPNSSQWSYQMYAIVSGLVPTNLVHAIGQLRDDDDTGLATANLPPALPKTNSVPTILAAAQPLFSPAYIVLTDANAAGWNPRQTLPFKLNEPALSFGSSSFNNKLDLAGNSYFWAFLVSFGYQPDGSEDQDYDEEPPLYGGTPETLGYSSGFSVLFVESVRELWINKVSGDLRLGNLTAAREKYWNLIAGDLAHEIGHSPGNQTAGNDHAEREMMAEGNIEFTAFHPKTIKRFRQTNAW